MYKYTVGFYLAFVTALSAIGLSMLFSAPSYGAEPETQVIIDNATALDAKVATLSAPSNRTFLFGPTVLYDVTVNGSAIIPPIDCSDAIIPDNLRKATPGSSCYLINYVLPAP